MKLRKTVIDQGKEIGKLKEDLKKVVDDIGERDKDDWLSRMVMTSWLGAESTYPSIRKQLQDINNDLSLLKRYLGVSKVTTSSKEAYKKIVAKKK